MTRNAFVDDECAGEERQLADEEISPDDEIGSQDSGEEEEDDDIGSQDSEEEEDGSQDSEEEEDTISDGDSDLAASPVHLAAPSSAKRARASKELKPAPAAKQQRVASAKLPREQAYVEYTLRDYATCEHQQLVADEIAFLVGDSDSGDEGPTVDTTAFTDLPALSEEQKEILMCVEKGENIVLMGKAGAGKSVCVKHIINQFSANGKKIGVFSYVGSAASIIRGSTINSAIPAKVWRNKAEFERTMLQMEKRILGAVRRFNIKNLPETDPIYKTIEMWRSLDMVIIDEISTCSPDVLYALHVVANACRYGMPRSGRCNCTMIGGLQCIVVGDMCQLAPIPLPENGVGSKQPEEKQYVFQVCT